MWVVHQSCQVLSSLSSIGVSDWRFSCLLDLLVLVFEPIHPPHTSSISPCMTGKQGIPYFFCLADSHFLASPFFISLSIPWTSCFHHYSKVVSRSGVCLPLSTTTITMTVIRSRLMTICKSVLIFLAISSSPALKSFNNVPAWPMIFLFVCSLDHSSHWFDLHTEQTCFIHRVECEYIIMTSTYGKKSVPAECLLHGWFVSPRFEAKDNTISMQNVLHIYRFSQPAANQADFLEW